MTELLVFPRRLMPVNIFFPASHVEEQIQEVVQDGAEEE